MQQEQERVAARLAELRRPESPAPELVERWDRIAALVGRLPELYQKANPAALRDVLVEMIALVELFFEHRMVGPRKMSRFVRGVVTFNEDIAPLPSAGTCFLRKLTCSLAAISICMRSPMT